MDSLQLHFNWALYVQEGAMKLARYALSALFAMMAGIGLVKIVMGELSPVATIFCIGYLCMVAALNKRGGKFALYISYFIAGFLSLLLFGAIFAVAMPIFGRAFDQVFFFASLLIGAIGISTVLTLKKLDATNI